MYFNKISGGSECVLHLERFPILWNAWIKAQRIALAFQSQEGFQNKLIHPPGRTGVPRPATSSNVRSYAVDIGRYHVRLNFIDSNFLRSLSVMDRIDQVQ